MLYIYEFDEIFKECFNENVLTWIYEELHNNQYFKRKLPEDVNSEFKLEIILKK
jgi:hypothetical protein